MKKNKMFALVLMMSAALITGIAGCGKGSAVSSSASASAAADESQAQNDDETIAAGFGEMPMESEDDPYEVVWSTEESDMEAYSALLEAYDIDPDDSFYGTDEILSVEWAPTEDNADADPAKCSFVADDSEYANNAIINSLVDIKNFSILKVGLDQVDDDGNLTFSYEVINTVDELKAGEDFVLRFANPGDTPAYGIAYEDAEDVQRKYAICESGMDGSLFLTAIE